MFNFKNFTVSTSYFTNKSVLAAVLFCFLLAFQGTIMAQDTGFSKSTSPTTRGAVLDANSGNKPVAGREQVNLPSTKRGGNKIVYGHLTMDREGSVLLDEGEGPTPLKNPTSRKTYRSIVGALNYLSFAGKWKIAHNYEITDGNPRPAFLLYRYVPIN